MIGQRKAGVGGEDKNPSLKDTAAEPERQWPGLGEKQAERGHTGLNKPRAPGLHSPSRPPSDAVGGPGPLPIPSTRGRATLQPSL